MKQTFDFYENVEFFVNVCDKDGVVLYQNARARKRDGDVVGKNLYDCHSERAGMMIRHMMETGEKQHLRDHPSPPVYAPPARPNLQRSLSPGCAAGRRVHRFQPRQRPCLRGIAAEARHQSQHHLRRSAL